MTLLTLCQDALAEIGEQEELTSIVGSSNPTAKQMLALAKRANRDLLKIYDWSILQKVHTWVSVADQQEYSLPSDYDRIINGTVWDRANQWPLHEATNPQDQQTLQSGIVNVATRRWFWVKGSSGAKKINLYPAPGTAGDTFALEYIQSTPILSAASTAKETFTADTDTTLIDEDLYRLSVKYQFLNSKGLPYAEALRQYEVALQQAKGNDAGARTLDFGGLPSLWPIPPNVPETGYGS